jgi:hypothetical protein
MLSLTREPPQGLGNGSPDSLFYLDDAGRSRVGPRTPALLARASIDENTDPTSGRGTGVEGLRSGDALLTLDSATDGPITVGNNQLQRVDSEVGCDERIYCLA